ncbi:MAG: response regulator transcription factor [Rhodospirillales bacterium]|jgi:DNA-binding response OmpR family regulator
MSLRLLLLSPDPALFKALSQQLTQQGFDCAEAGADFDAVLLDGAQAPDPGLGPVLRLIGPQEETDEECLTKPVRLAQLVARLRRLAERFQSRRPRRIGEWELEAQTGQLIRGGESQKLTGKEAAILIELFDADGAMGRETLLENIWGYGSNISTHTLETHIYRLRQKIEADPGEPQVLLTLEGGYLLKKS